MTVERGQFYPVVLGTWPLSKSVLVSFYGFC